MHPTLLKAISRKQRMPVTADPSLVEKALGDFLESVGATEFSHYRKTKVGLGVGFEFFCSYIRESRRFRSPMSAENLARIVPSLNMRARFPPQPSDDSEKGWNLVPIEEGDQKGIAMLPAWKHKEKSR